MRNSPRIIGLALFFLAGCTRPGDLPVEDVLRRSADASRALQSVTLNVEGTVRIAQAESIYTLRPTVRGTLHNGGKQVQVRVGITGTLQEDESTFDLTADIETIVASMNEVYVQVHRLQTTPTHPLLNAEALSAITGTWMQLPINQAVVATADVTPDPRLLRAQSEVVTVTRDRGMEMFNEKEVYVYDVQVDPEKLLAYLRQVAKEDDQPFDEAEARTLFANYHATGTIWIDAKDFTIQRLHWDIAPKDPNAEGITANITVDFTDHNAAAPIVPPTSAVPLPGTGLPVESESSSSVNTIRTSSSTSSDV